VAETGKTVPQIALNWLLQRPTVVSVILGARNDEPLRQNLGAVGWSLTHEQAAKLDAASERPSAYPYCISPSSPIEPSADSSLKDLNAGRDFRRPIRWMSRQYMAIITVLSRHA